MNVLCVRREMKSIPASYCIYMNICIQKYFYFIRFVARERPPHNVIICVVYISGLGRYIEAIKVYICATKGPRAFV